VITTQPHEYIGCYGEFADPRGNHLGYLSGGLTKREYFSAMAMQGYLANSGEGCWAEPIPKMAVDMADLMIDELNKRNSAD